MILSLITLLLLSATCCAFLFAGPRRLQATRRPCQASSVEVDEEEEMRRLSYELLDCLTATKDEDNPEYSLEKDMRRDRLLAENDYSDLKMELKSRGLSASGDKQEMMIRLLLSILDPSINFRELSGREPTLKYVEAEDLKPDKLAMVPEEQRRRSTIDDEPDAEDMQLYKTREGRISSSRNNAVGGVTSSSSVDATPAPAPVSSGSARQRVIMDGLSRQEVQFRPLNTRRDFKSAKKQDEGVVIGAYISGSRDVLRTWERSAVVVVVLPDRRLGGWRGKDMRVLADEIAFLIQAIVVVPDIRSADADAGTGTATATGAGATAFDDVVSALHYARSQFDSRGLCLAGVGTGAALALRCSCALTDISCLLSSKDSSLKAVNGSSLSSDRFEADPSIAALAPLGSGEGEAEGEGEGEGDEAEGVGEDGLLRPVKSFSGNDNGDDEEGEAEGEEEGDEEAQWMRALKELGDRYDEEDRLAAEAAAPPRPASASASASASEPDSVQGEVKDEDVLKAISRADIAASAQQAKERQAANALRRSLAAAARAEAAREAERAAEAADRAACERAARGRFVNAEAALSPLQLARLVPKAVLALCPVDEDKEGEGGKREEEGYLEVVGRALRLPSLVVFPDQPPAPEPEPEPEPEAKGKGKGKSKGKGKVEIEGKEAGKDQASTLLALLQRRSAEVVDFSIRAYESLGGVEGFLLPSSASASGAEAAEAATAAAEARSKARLDALTVGAVWLEAFSRAEYQDRTEGTGRTKYSPEDALTRVTAADLEGAPSRVSLVTAELHDDPDLFRNERIGYGRRAAREGRDKQQQQQGGGEGEGGEGGEGEGGESEEDWDVTESLLSKKGL